MEKAIRDRVEKWKKEHTIDGKDATNEHAYESLNELILDGKKLTSIKNEEKELLKKF